MASENLVLRSGTWHVRLTVPKDVRHVLNRSEFTESLKTGSKPEAQMKKLAFLHVWKQAIATARQRIAGPTPAELPETSYNIAKMIASSRENALMSLVLPQEGKEVDPRFTQSALDELGSFIIDVMLQCHGWQSPEDAKVDLYKQKPFLE